MKIYTGQHFSDRIIEKIRTLDMGIMLSSCPKVYLSKGSCEKIRGISLALDNGAFSAYKKGMPFNEYCFLKTLSKCLEFDLMLDFIILPEIVCGGDASLSFSLKWAERIPCNKLALPIQPGISRDGWQVIEQEKHLFSTMFIGGFMGEGEKYQWDNLPFYINFASVHGKKIHVGKVGTLDKLRYCRDLGVDSCDSTNFVRNDRFCIVEEFMYPTNKQGYFWR